MSWDKLRTGFKKMEQGFRSSDQNTTGQSQTASGSGTVIEKSKPLELISLDEGKLDGASALPSTDKQAQKKLYYGSSLLSRILSIASEAKSFIDSIRRRNVQVYLAVDTPEGVDTALKKLCKDMSYECKIIKQTHTLQHDVPLIVVCPVMSRLEPDIDHALNGLDWRSRFIVLVLHQGNEDSLPGLPTKTRLPDKPKYEKAIFVDMAYSLEFYACQKNEDANQEIQAFVDSFNK